MTNRIILDFCFVITNTISNSVFFCVCVANWPFDAFAYEMICTEWRNGHWCVLMCMYTFMGSTIHGSFWVNYLFIDYYYFECCDQWTIHFSFAQHIQVRAYSSGRPLHSISAIRHSTYCSFTCFGNLNKYDVHVYDVEWCNTFEEDTY